MFREARIKLTAWYLGIIMLISLSFSVVIYAGINRELIRIDTMQRQREQRTTAINVFLRTNGLPVPSEPPTIESETVEAIRLRIIATLGVINASILILAGAGGYFLAGLTLDPIRKNMEEQKEFVGNASHELRTPLTSLTSEIEVALRDKTLSKEAARNLLKSNLEDVKRMSKLSNYLLALNRFENKSDEIPMKKVDLAEVVKKATEKMNVTTNLKKTIVNGNEDSLIELVTILTDNAIKYGKGKKVIVRTKSGGILEVEDNGVGIAKVDLPHIFERFYRSDKSRETDGYGLGLAIAKSIIDTHNGTIKVESKLGKGTKFTAWL